MDRVAVRKLSIAAAFAMASLLLAGCAAQTGEWYTAKIDSLEEHAPDRALEMCIRDSLCSCTMCRRWSGAPTVAWVEFPLADFEWTGPAGEPRRFRSSEKSERANCPTCGSAICTFDDGYDNVSLVVGSLDRPNLIVPDVQHSYRSKRPTWWHPEVGKKG